MSELNKPESELNQTQSEIKHESKQGNKQGIIVMVCFGLLLFVIIAFEIYSKK